MLTSGGTEACTVGMLSCSIMLVTLLCSTSFNDILLAKQVYPKNKKRLEYHPANKAYIVIPKR